ncbi:MAG TPA: CYTH domain-containing protein [Pseudogracilibacillus sp.]|nr:CYTH domain-containing protein [Pseudogracilibacillus sp.]
MNQEIEIEFKTVIQENDFKALHKQLPFDDQPVKQINYYFETNQQDFKRKRCALRIREKAGKYTLTLKEPHKEGILETHDELTKEECTAWLQGQPVIKPNTNKQLAALGIQEKNIFYFGALKTERYTYQTTDLLYVLDKSEYNQQLDYELELEATDYTAGEQAFGELLKQYNIIKQEPVTKIERFFNTLQEGNNPAFEE